MITALNLLPVGQLDGGHIAHALFGRARAGFIGKVALGGMGSSSSSGWSRASRAALEKCISPRRPPALMGTSLALLALARGTAAVFALVALYAIGIGLLTPAKSALVSRRGGAHAGAALGLASGAKSLGQIAGPVLGGVLFGTSVAVPFWLASGLLLGLAPVFAWSGRRTQEPPSGRAARAKVAFGSQEAR